MNIINKGLLWFRDMIANRRLIINLANKEFRMRYAASYLGIFWAFVQPIVTITIYIVVFQLRFNAAPVRGVPYSLWLVIGMVPWLFFQEALMSATNCLLEFSYLVKKVVFKISVLPIVKIIPAVYIHAFFVGLAVIVYLCFGKTPHIYMLQAIYYTFAAVVLTLGLSFITASMVVFFRDLSQIVNILLQFGMWLTPVLWDVEGMSFVTPFIHRILKLNPVYYITSGYRDAFLDKVWFWEKGTWTIYFWVLTLAIGAVGTFTFKRLEKHFADVL